MGELIGFSIVAGDVVPTSALGLGGVEHEQTASTVEARKARARRSNMRVSLLRSSDAKQNLRQHAKGEKIQVSSSGSLDHQFAVIGDTKKEKNNELVVADPWVNKPTACLWEDHFAFSPDLNIDHGGGVADGKSFKGAIAAGLQLTAFGKKLIEKAETEEKTKKMVDDDDHAWNNDDSVAPGKKFDYQATKPAVGKEAATGSSAVHK